MPEIVDYPTETLAVFHSFRSLIVLYSFYAGPNRGYHQGELLDNKQCPHVDQPSSE